MKRIEFTIREYPNFIQVRICEKFTLHMLNGIVMLTFHYPSGSEEYKSDVIYFKEVED